MSKGSDEHGARLIGTARATEDSPATDTRELKGKLKHINIRTHEHYGDSNSYPQATQAKANTWTNSVREGGTAVLIIQHPQGIGAMHYWGEHMQGREGKTHLDVLDAPRPPLPGQRNLIVFSQYADKRLKNKFSKDTFFARTWPDVITQIENRHSGKVRVAVYPYAAIQHPETRLDGPDGRA